MIGSIATILDQRTIGVTVDVIHERIRQNMKWGPQNHTQMEWLGILAEEFGEAAKEVNELYFRPGVALDSPVSVDEQRKKLRAELIQTAAVAVAMVESLDRNGR